MSRRFEWLAVHSRSGGHVGGVHRPLGERMQRPFARQYLRRALGRAETAAGAPNTLPTAHCKPAVLR